MTSRRTLLTAGTAIAGAVFLFRRPHAASAEKFEIELPEAEWQKRLSPAAFNVLRHESTERPFTSALVDEHRKGIFACAGCDLPLFDQAAKFDSGTGWPSFSKPLDNAVGMSSDRQFLMERTEVHCRRCGGHLGHVFDDGPQPAGLRYCMNGVAMQFHPSVGA